MNYLWSLNLLPALALALAASAALAQDKTYDVGGEADAQLHYQLKITGPGLEKPFVFVSTDTQESMSEAKVLGPLVWVDYMVGGQASRQRVFDMSCKGGPKLVFDGGIADGDVETPDASIIPTKKLTISVVKENPDPNKDDMKTCRATIEFGQCQVVRLRCR
jgi:hypothetical protein